MALLKLKFEASSILEIIVAMVIISVITSISLLIFVNTVTSLESDYGHQLEVKTQYYLNTYEFLTEEQKDGFVDNDGYEVFIEKKETYVDHLFEIQIFVTDSLQINTVSKRKLIYQYE